MTPDIATNRSGTADVLRHLRACDAAFHPPLSSRLDLTAYAAKLASLALRVEAWSGDDLIGLVAVYANAPDRGTAFVSNVSVLPGHTGQGIARTLLQRAILQVRAMGFTTLALEVNGRATPALRLYAVLGFQPAAAQDGETLAMTLTLT